MPKIILKCVLEKNKLRIKFHQFINKDGEIFNNIYNNNYNCQFPKDIRKEGRFYEIGENDLTTVMNREKPFYRVNKKNIKILDDYIEKIDIDKIKVFNMDFCIVCYSDVPNIINIPCGHQCMCEDCYKLIENSNNLCPICRKEITQKFKV